MPYAYIAVPYKLEKLLNDVSYHLIFSNNMDEFMCKKPYLILYNIHQYYKNA